ncbi:MAG: shikimate kinase [Pseudomonadota bacterium]
MNSGYYDYHAAVIPERPITLIGLPGARVPMVGATMAALTGLSLRELDHAVEHRAGGTVSSIFLDRGESHFRTLESETLGRLVREKPPGIIVLGDGALLARQNRKLVARQTTLVYLRTTAFALYARLRDELTESPGKFFHLFPAVPDRPSDVQALLRSREPSYRGADVVQDMADHHPREIARTLIAKLALNAT